MVAKRDDWMSVEDFLALDRENLDQKYEFVNGKMIAMAGGTVNHGIIIGNLVAIIRPHLRGKPCRLLSEGTLKIESASYLPDIMVTCNEKDITENKTYVEHPKVVIEVLSPTTERIDRRDKVLAYARCLSIQEYVLVSWDFMLVQKMTRKDIEGGNKVRWFDEWYNPGDSVELATIDLSILVDNFYEDVILSPFEPFREFRKRNTP